MSAAKRPDAGAAVAGLFARHTTTGGLAAGRQDHAAINDQRPQLAGGDDPGAASAVGVPATAAGAPVRLGVELDEDEIAWLRGVSRPARTGAPRYLGAKFVATGLLTTAIHLARAGGIDMYGITAGDDSAMAARAHEALVRAALKQTDRPDTPADSSPETTP
jgi:hypothetical protein